MISAGEFRNGVTFEQDGQVLQVVEFQHVKPGKGAAFVRTKTKNVITGSVVETSYNPTGQVPAGLHRAQGGHLLLRGRRPVPLHGRGDLRRYPRQRFRRAG